MSLFVPVLRLAMLFLNVWDAYKTLKPPPPSLRDPTRPSVRASTQRKRDMKGVLAVWICSFAAYERLVESFVSLFIPFYDEFKSMFMLFLILTRARGAEPIFLHIIRPLIKPYTSTLDGIFDLLRHIGDFLFALSSFPVHLAIARWHRWRNPPQEPDVSIIEESDSETSSSQAYSVAPSASSRITRDAAQHEIWVPPQSSHDEEEEEEAFDAPPEILELTLEEKAVEEWSKYPAFPSAYPASPTTTHSFLESASSFSQSLAEASVAAQSTHLYGASQGFQRSLLSARSRQNPGYGQGGSDQRSASGIHQRSAASSSSATLSRTNSGSATAVQPSQYDEVDDSMDEDHLHEEEEYDHYDRDALLSPGPYKSNASYSGSEVDDEEEDIFNMTLRTPLPPHGAARSRALMARLTIPLPLGSANSMNSSNSTALPSARTTASTLRTGSEGGGSDDAGSLGPSPVGYGGEDGLGLLIGGGGDSEDLEMTITGRTRGTGARKRKAASAVSISGLQELTETSDAGDGGDDDDEEEAADGDAEIDADGDAAMEDGEGEGESKKGAGGRDVKHEVKRRRVGVSPPGLRKGAAANANGGVPAKAGIGIQPRAGAGMRKPLAAKPAANSSSAAAAANAKGASVKGGAKGNGSTPSLSSASASATAGLAKKSGAGGAHAPVRAQGRAGAGAGAAAKGAVVNGKGGLPGKKVATTVTVGAKQVRAAASGSSTGSST